MLQFAELMPSYHCNQLAELIAKLPAFLVIEQRAWYKLTEDLEDVRQNTSVSDMTFRNLLSEVVAIWKEERFEHQKIVAEKDLKINSNRM